MGRHYTDEQRTEALAALDLNGGNAARKADKLGIPRPTLVRWRKEHEAVSARRQMVQAEQPVDVLYTEKSEHAERWSQVQHS